MVTYNTMVLNVPKSWDEFEDICKSSFQLRWSNTGLTRHGRQGQKQNGVDVYGYDAFNNFIGIQCKNTVSGVNQSTIESEIIKAEKFKPEIRYLFIATTAPRDVTIQAFVRNLNESRRAQGKFLVSVEFWDDITADLVKDPAVLRMHYPQMFQQTQPTKDEFLRKRDVSNLLKLLNCIDFHSTIDHLQWGAKYIHSLIIEEYDNILETINSPVFELNDKKLERAIIDLGTAWRDLIMLFRSAPYNYLSEQDTHSFINPGDFCRNKEEEELFDEISAKIRTLRTKIDNFCRFINNNYHEVNLNDTSACARRRY